MNIFNLSETLNRAKLLAVADYLRKILPNKNSFEGKQTAKGKKSINTAKNPDKNPTQYKYIVKNRG